MTGDEIRELFLSYFETKGHLRMPSASLVPSGDPTLLFTSAGMVPFKPFFQGEQTPPSRRLASSQKSFRTTDIDEVGDHTHLTMFEMLGNFSIGDYFKKEAVAFAWEFVTSKSVGFGLEPERFYATIHHTDDEAYELWHNDVGIPSERIYRYGDADNWWGPAGLEGPCGPCSELHYDFGPEFGCGKPMADPSEDYEKGCHPNHECARIVELWNLVFMQFYQDLEGGRTPLPAPSVDTGMGLERAAIVMQRHMSIYDTDLFQPLVAKASKLSGKAYGQDAEMDYALRVVAEHARASAFLISDGVVPSNEGRGYVLRRIIRRAVRYGRRLGLERPFMEEMASAAIDNFREAYPDLETNRGFILRVLKLEEERFNQTIQVAMPMLEEGLIPLHLGLRDAFGKPHNNTVAAKALTLARITVLGGEEGGFVRPQSVLEGVLVEARADVEKATSFPIESRLTEMLTGREVFVLHDTFGFPRELTEEIARERGLGVDAEGFEREVEAHRARARKARVSTGGMEIQSHYEELASEAVEFVGYGALERGSEIAALLVGGEQTGRASKGQKVEVVLRETPFYAEGGGQVGDVGSIAGPNGMIQVKDTQNPTAGLIVHKGVVSEGYVSLGDPVSAKVDVSRRQSAARNHSGTHILHASLRAVLGPHVRQAGSLVTPERMRFDFSHVGAVEREEMRDIQALANEKVRQDMAVSTHVTTYAEAVNAGALAFFGDKYGGSVRVVTMSGGNDDKPFSVELCGGTHVHATGEVGPLFVLGESSIGGGMRRVEAVTGEESVALFQERSDILQRIAGRLETPVSDLEERLEGFVSDVRALRRQVAQLERKNLRMEAEGLLGQVSEAKGVKVLAARTSAGSVEALREMGDWLKAKLESGVLVLAMAQNGRPLLVSMVTPDLVTRGLHAGNIVSETAQKLGGGGGGRPESAQAGGRRLDALPQALAEVADIVEREVRP